MKNYKQLLKNITTLVFDVDGVLTDGTVLLFEQGDFIRTMNVRDGFALQLAVKKGYRVAIISGGTSQAVAKRFEYLGVQDIFLSVSNKLPILKEYMQKYKISKEEVLYMGDDIPDIEMMNYVGLPTCPVDAANEIKDLSLYISSYKGGAGCARDVIEQVMKAQSKWIDNGDYHW